MLCDKLSYIGIIPECRKKVYIYGFELMLSSAVGIFSMIILSALVGKPFAWIPYLIGFIPLRVTGGGYHAKTHFTCIVSFSFVFLILLILSDTIYLIPYIYFIVACISLGITYFLAPVEAVNKPLLDEVRQKNRIRCVGVSWLNIIVSLVALIAGIDYGIHLTMYYAGVFSAGSSMVFVVLRDFYEKNTR